MKKLLILLLFPCFLNAQTFRAVTMPATDIPVNGNIIIRSGNLWRLGDTALLNLSYKNALLARVFYSDTANMLAAYRNAMLGKVWYSDTSNMLAAYRAALLTFAPLSHTQNASTILAGSFPAGNFLYQDNLTIQDTLKLGTGATANLLYQSAAGSVTSDAGSFIIAANGTFRTTGGLANTATLNNAYFATPNGGAQISRNVADAGSAATIIQTHASSTGNILVLQRDASAVAVYWNRNGSMVQSSGAANLLYNTTDQTTNTEYLRADFSGNVARIFTGNSGTGTLRNLSVGTLNRSLIFTESPATNGAFFDLAATTGGTNFNGARLSGTLSQSSGTYNELAITKTVSQTATAGFNMLYVSARITSAGSGTKLLENIGKNSNANFDPSTHTVLRSTDTLGNGIFAGSITSNTGFFYAPSGAAANFGSVGNNTVRIISTNLPRFLMTGGGDATFDKSGTFTATPSALVAVASTTQGLLPPRMTTTQKNAIASPAEGLTVYDLTLHKLCVFTGTVWETLTSL